MKSANKEIKNKHIIENITWSFLDSREEIFSTIYDRNLWGSKESISGKGSELNFAKNIINKLPELFRIYNIKTLVDAPCGDFNWMRKINYNFQSYLGVDIVKDLITDNIKLYSNDSIIFDKGDILTYVFPKADLILCRDCFIHLNTDEIKCAINNFKKSGSKYLLTTNFNNIIENENISTGQFRKINLCLKPFNFPMPISEIIEESSNDKYLSLFKLEDIKL